MNKEENNFEAFLKTQLENHTVEVSDSVWASIEKKQKKRGIFVWFKQYLNVYIALDVLILMGFAAFSTLNSNKVQSQNQPQKSVLYVAQELKKKEKSQAIKVNAMAQNEIVKYTINKEEKNYITEDEVKKVINASKETNKNEQQIHPQQEVSSIKAKTKTLIINKENSETNIESKTKISEHIEKKLPTMAAKSLSSENLIAKIKLKPYNVSLSGVSIANDSPRELEYLPASIILNKPKKVTRIEQKKAVKAEKELAKQLELTHANNSASNENIVLPNTNTNTEIDTKGAALESEEAAPMAFDTVYGKKKFKGYVAIDALISPDIAGRSLKANNEIAQNYITRRDSAESLRIGFTTQMRMNLFFNRNIFIQSGISFSQRKEKFSVEHKWQTREDYVDSSKYVTIVDPFVGNIIYKTYDTLEYVTTNKENVNHQIVMSFLDVPVMAGYKWLGKRSGIAIQAGVICNLLFKQKGIVAEYDYTANDVVKDNKNPFNSSAGLSLAGAISSNFKLNDKLDLLFEPHTRYVLKPINTAAYPIQQKIFTYGLHVGLRLKL
jgi:hypothetical protein